MLVQTIVVQELAERSRPLLHAGEQFLRCRTNACKVANTRPRCAPQPSLLAFASVPGISCLQQCQPRNPRVRLYVSGCEEGLRWTRLAVESIKSPLANLRSCASPLRCSCFYAGRSVSPEAQRITSTFPIQPRPRAPAARGQSRPSGKRVSAVLRTNKIRAGYIEKIPDGQHKSSDQHEQPTRSSVPSVVCAAP